MAGESAAYESNERSAGEESGGSKDGECRHLVWS